MGGYLHALLVQEGVAFIATLPSTAPGAPDRSIQFNNAGAFAGSAGATILSNGEVLLIPRTDADPALVAHQFSNTQSAAIVDFVNQSTALVALGILSVRGKGLGNVDGFGSTTLLNISNDGNDYGLTFTNTALPAGTFAFNSFSSPGGYLIGSSNAAGTVFPAMSFNSQTGVIVIQAGTGGATITVDATGGVKFNSKIGFYNTAPVAKQTVTGSKGANAALASLMTALVAIGLFTDTTT